MPFPWPKDVLPLSGAFVACFVDYDKDGFPLAALCFCPKEVFPLGVAVPPQVAHSL